VGSAGERKRDHDALAHAARKLRTDRHGSVRAAARYAPGRAPRWPCRSGTDESTWECCSSTSSICFPTLRIGLSAARGSGRSSKSPATQGRAPRPRARCARRMPENITEPSADAAGTVEDAHHRIGGDGFSRARFADDRQRLALGDAESDVLHRANDARRSGLESMSESRSRCASCQVLTRVSRRARPCQVLKRRTPPIISARRGKTRSTIRPTP